MNKRREKQHTHEVDVQRRKANETVLKILQAYQKQRRRRQEKITAAKGLTDEPLAEGVLGRDLSALVCLQWL